MATGKPTFPGILDPQDMKEEKGLSTFELDISSIWVPSIITPKGSENGLLSFPNKAFVKSSGQFLINNPDKMSTSCYLNLDRYPFDVHNCTIPFVLMDYGINPLVGEDVYHQLEKFFHTSAEWRLLGFGCLVVETPNYTDPPIFHTPNYTDPPIFKTPNYTDPPIFQTPNYTDPPIFQTPNYNYTDPPIFQTPNYTDPPIFQTPNYNYTECWFSMERRSIFYVASLLVPVILISTMTDLVFCIPAESGEKISYVISIFLSMTVFVNFLVEFVPRSMGKLPRIMQLITAVMVKIALIAMATIFVLNVYKKKRNKQINRKQYTNSVMNEANPLLSRSVNSLEKMSEASYKSGSSSKRCGKQTAVLNCGAREPHETLDVYFFVVFVLVDVAIYTFVLV
ncbi:acetylcholine receptor subunit delta-like [Physella acuta]|uniref:acetylcholine receptor subunit delta-like n=1 Tax=Physella acuta TaxID=109671 RepID=UPI0027DE83B1|nr:acetylcholine receptor subunit delta-like [Physella acuta]